MPNGIVFDTDFLSAICLVDKFDLVKSLYPNYEYIVPFSVRNELLNFNYKNSKKIQTNYHKYRISFDLKEVNEIMIDDPFFEIWSRLRAGGFKGGPSIDPGEAEVIALATYYKNIVASDNLKDVRKYSQILHFDLITISQCIYRNYKLGFIDFNTADVVFSTLINNGYKIARQNTFQDYLDFLEEK